MEGDIFFKITDFLQQKNFRVIKPKTSDELNSTYLTYLRGQGGQSYVFSGQNTINGIDVAIKVQFIDEIEFKLIQEEQNIISNIKIKKQIVEIYQQFYLHDLTICIQILELCQSSLDEEIQKRKQIYHQYSPVEISKIMFFCINALYEIHSNGISHQNIKPSNILISSSGNYKLADLSFLRRSKKIEPDNERLMEVEYDNSSIQILKSQDIYSLGLTFLQLLDLQLDNENQKFIQKRDLNQVQSQVNPKYKNYFSFIWCFMLQTTFEKRYTIVRLRKRFLDYFDYQISVEEDIQRINSILNEYEEQKIEKDKNYAFLLLQLSQLNEQNQNESAIEDCLSIIQNIYQQQSTYETTLFLEEYSRMLFNKSEYKLALDVNQQTIDILQTLDPQNKFEISFQLQLKANNFQQLGNLQESIFLTQQSLQILNSIFQEDHPDIANTLLFISQLYFYIFEFQNTQLFSLQSLKMSQLLFSDDHPLIADCLRGVGICCYGLKNYEQSQKYFLSALTILETIGSKNNQRMAQLIDNIGSTHYQLNNTNESLKYQIRALKLRESTIINNKFRELGQSYHNIGNIFYYLDQYQKSIICLLKSIKLQSKFDSGNTCLALAAYNCGITYGKMRNYDKCLSLYKKALERRRLTYPENHSSIIEVKNKLKSLRSKI